MSPNFIYKLVLFLLLLIIPLSSHAQYVWTDLSEDEELPDGVKLIRGYNQADQVLVFLLDVDLDNPDIIIHPYFSNTFRSTTNFTTHVGAIAAINGGYFGGSTSLSALVEPGQLRSQNLSAVNRDGTTYYVTRPMFSINEDFSMSIDWIYHFGSTLDDIIKFDNPSPNAPGSPAPVPVRNSGSSYEQLLMGIGGGPVLVKNGEVRYTYDEEGFFGNSGLVGNNAVPRSAVGYTDDNRVLLVAVESRPRGEFFSYGINLPNLAQLMISLGAVEAMNLDGGGSTTMAVGSKLINMPNGNTFQRPVPTILAVTHADSLKLPPPPMDEVIIDTEDDGVTIVGDGWFQTANFGDSYGGASSPSWLIPPGDGSAYVEYLPELLNAKYEVFGWWSASSNRTNNTPYSIDHTDGTDVVRVDQKVNNAQWVSLGEFTFTGTESDRVVISNDATGGDFVVADAIRFVQLEPAIVSIETDLQKATSSKLHQNYPNPFNPTTTIQFDLSTPSQVNLSIYDLTGRLVKTSYSGWMLTGSHSIQVNADGLSSGTYMYVLETDNSRDVRLMTLIK